MFAQSRNPRPVIQDNIETRNRTPEKFSTYRYPKVNPIMRLPVLGDLAKTSISKAQFELVEPKLVDTKSLSKWLLNAYYNGWIEAQDLNSSLPAELHKASDTALTVLSKQTEFEQVDFRDTYFDLMLKDLNKQFWARMALFGIEIGVLNKEVIKTTLYNKKDTRQLTEVSVEVERYYNEVIESTISKTVSDSCKAANIHIDLFSKRHESQVVFSAYDFSVYSMDSFIEAKDEAESFLVKKTFSLIDHAFCNMLLPDHYSDMYLDGYNWVQQELEFLNEKKMLNDPDKALQYIKKNSKDFEFLRCKNTLNSALELKDYVKKISNDWSNAKCKISKCFDFAKELMHYSESCVDKTQQCLWMEKVARLFLTSFQSQSSWEEFYVAKENEIEVEGYPLIIIFIEDELFRSDVIQPIYEDYMNGIKFETYMNINDNSSFFRFEEHLKLISIGHALVAEANQKNELLV